MMLNWPTHADGRWLPTRLNESPVPKVPVVVPRLPEIQLRRPASSSTVNGRPSCVLLPELHSAETVVVATVWPERDRLETMVTSDPLIILADFVEMGTKIFLATLMIVTLIAFADYLYVRQKWWKKQMMTLQETKDEYKQMEGDPHIKGKLRQLRQEKSRRRMMQAVPDATVVITNPTHFAVALQYDKAMGAPKCVAKGADAVAFRIREVAKQHDVPIVENPPLARALYASMEIDDTIPNEHFKAVAEVIGFVMRLKKGAGWKSR